MKRIALLLVLAVPNLRLVRIIAGTPEWSQWNRGAFFGLTFAHR